MRILRMIVALAGAFEHDSPDFHRLRVSRGLMIRCLENLPLLRNVGPAPSPVIFIFIVYG